MSFLVPRPKLCLFLPYSLNKKVLIQCLSSNQSCTPQKSHFLMCLSCQSLMEIRIVTEWQVKKWILDKQNIFFLSLEMGCAETVIQVLVSKEDSDYLLLMSCLNLPKLKWSCLSIMFPMPVMLYLPGWKHCQLTLWMNNVTNLKPCPLAKNPTTFQGKWDESSIKMFRIFKSMPETTPA